MKRNLASKEEHGTADFHCHRVTWEGCTCMCVAKGSNRQLLGEREGGTTSSSLGSCQWCHTSTMRPLGQPPPRAISRVRAPLGVRSLQQQQQPGEVLEFHWHAHTGKCD